MPKSYPLIDQKGFATLYSYNPAPNKGSYLIDRVYQNTTGTTSPGYPFTLQWNPFRSEKYSFRSTPISYDPFNGDRNYPGYSFISHISSPSFYGAPNDVVARAEYAAAVRFYSQIPQITANLALLYAERKKTYESAVIAITGILKCVREVRKGKVPELFMSAKELAGRKRFSGAWLNYTYGIAPFASDLHALACSDLKQIVYLKGIYTEPYTRYIKTGKNGFIMNNGTYRVVISAGLSLANPITATLAGSGMLNPALIAWELTPFSFMADWVYPVGPYLEMLSSTGGFNKHNGGISRGTKESYRQQDERGAFAEGEYKLTHRIATEFPSAPFPRLKNPFSPIHALNLLTILHQLVKAK